MTQPWRLRATRTSLAIQAKLERGRLLTAQPHRPTIVPLGRLLRMIETEERLAEIDRVLDERWTR